MDSKLTQRLPCWDPGPDEVEPEEQLRPLQLQGIQQGEGDQLDAAGVADEVIVEHVVRLVAGEFPHREFPNT